MINFRKRRRRRWWIWTSRLKSPMLTVMIIILCLIYLIDVCLSAL